MRGRKMLEANLHHDDFNDVDWLSALIPAEPNPSAGILKPANALSTLQSSGRLPVPMFRGLGLLAAVDVAPSNALIGGNALSKTCRPTYLEDFAFADFGQELQKPYWTIDDSVPILLGIDPAFAQVSDFAPNRYKDEKATEAMRLRSLVQQAQEVGDLDQRFRPYVLINWAIGLHIFVPEKLLQIALDRGMAIIGYLNRVESLIEHYTSKAKLAATESASQSARIVELNTIIGEQANQLAALMPKVEQLQNDLRQAAENASEISKNERPCAQTERTGPVTRSYNMACKLLFGLAKLRYELDFASTQKSKTSEIMSDLEQVGIAVDDETLQKHLMVGSDQAAK